MTVLVTGASGLIGSHLCKRLSDEGVTVIGLTHNRENPLLSAIHTISCDVQSHKVLDSIIGSYRPETVFHFASHLPHTPNPDFIDVNVNGTVNLLDACYRNKVKNFIYASSMSVYSTPPVHLPVDENHPTRPSDTYGRTKLIGELLCNCYCGVMRVISVRFSSVFGVGDESRVVSRFMQSALAGKPIEVDGDGSQSSDFIHVDDAVEGTLLALDKGVSGEVYNIGSGQETSILELATLISDMYDPSASINSTNKPATRPFRFVADINRARRELGYTPSLMIDGLKKYREELDDKE